MKLLPVLFTVLVVTFFSCKSNQKKTSESYSQIKGFLKSAGINDPNLVFFYEDKPRMPLPNVYCFDSGGVQLNTPPQCFSYLRDFIVLLGDSTMPKKNGGEQIGDFIDSVHIMDAYDLRLEYKDLGSYDYYLFVDYISLPVPTFKETLFEAVKYTRNSKRKIRLFLIHAISEKNARYLKEGNGIFETPENADSTANGDTLKLSF